MNTFKTHIFIILSFMVNSVMASDATVSHPFVCADILKGQIMKVNAAGKVTWSHPAGYVHDIWALSNGNILFSGFRTDVQEITPDKKVVWQYKAKRNKKGRITERIFGCQPLPNGDVLVSIGGRPNKLIEVKRDGTIAKTIPLKISGQIRLARKSKNGNYIVAARSEKTVHIYNSDGKRLRKLPVPGGPYLACELENGNILVGCGEGHTIVEIDSNNKIVWQIKENDLAGHPLRFIAGFQRLPNGNTVICNWGGHGHIGKQAQFIEVTRDKKVVWQVFDNKQLGTPTHIQLLDIPGDSSKGELYR